MLEVLQYKLCVSYPVQSIPLQTHGLCSPRWPAVGPGARLVLGLYTGLCCSLFDLPEELLVHPTLAQLEEPLWCKPCPVVN